MDAKDILGLPKNSFPSSIEKKSRPPKESQRKPDGISREVYALTGGVPPLMPAVDASQLKKKAPPLEKVTWQWLPFTNSARKDDLNLYHWVRIVNGVLPTGDYSFAKYNKSVDIIKYTDEEYEKFLTDPMWTKEETNELFDLCERFDLRFVVIADRFTSSRTVEELKSRYHSVSRAILLARATSSGDVATHPLIKEPYNVSQEMERKRALSMVLSQTRQQEKRDEEVLIEAKRIAELRMASKVTEQPQMAVASTADAGVTERAVPGETISPSNTYLLEVHFLSFPNIKALTFIKTKMMLKRQSHLFSFSLAILISLLYSTTTTLSQLSPAAAPIQPTLPSPTTPAASPKPLVPSLPESPTDSTPDTAAVDIVGILRKAKSFNVLIRLMKTTQLINQLNSQLLTTKTGGLTILAPDDSAFSELKAGFLNSLSDGQKLELLQFHVISDYVSSSNFDILTNPVRTLAGAKPGKVELNVVSYGGSVNISTGEVNTTINGIIYTDKHLAIYKVGKVLLPMDFFTVAKAPAKGPSLAPEPSTDTAKTPKPDKDVSSDSSQVGNPKEQNSGSGKIVYGKHVSFGLIIVMVAMMQT